MKPITRNDVSVALAVLSAIVVIAAPIAAMFAIWQGDLRWLWTGIAMLPLAIALYYIATVLFDNEPGPKR